MDIVVFCCVLPASNKARDDDDDDDDDDMKLTQTASLIFTRRIQCVPYSHCIMGAARAGPGSLYDPQCEN